MSMENREVLRRWAEDLTSTGAVKRKYRGGTVHVDAAGVIHYERKSGHRRNQWGPVVLGTFVEKTRTVVLNGDGFTDNNATNWQTRLRDNVRLNMLRASRNGGSKIESLAIIPYAALTAAGVDISTIRALEVIEDTIEEIWHQLPPPPKTSRLSITNEQGNRRVLQATIDGVIWRTSQTCRIIWRNKVNPSETYTYQPYVSAGKRVENEYDILKEPWKDSNVWEVSGTNADGERDWRRVNLFDAPALARRQSDRDRTNENIARGVQNWGNFVTGEIPQKEGWYWFEQVHHLGACLFSAVGDDGKRHKFVSAFDRDEPARMYFLAQLPDRSGANTYEEAVAALAPPIVHKAREDGRAVFRQGDVFAVETKLTDEEVYAQAKTRVRREVALWNLDGRRVSRIIAGLDDVLMPADGEFREKIDCPCRCGHKRWTGSGPKARRALMIYGTGHTADEVVVGPKGVTFIRGTMHHDPALETPGRAREHIDVILPDGKWFLAVRNTVPRRRRSTDSDSSTPS